MIIVQRRYNGTDFEQMATFENGELDGDEDFIDAFGYLFEGEIDEDVILERFSGPNLIASIPEGDETEEEGDSGDGEGEEGEQVERSSDGPDVVHIEKYRVYLGEAEDISEAEEGAPDWANVQEGTQGGFFYNTEDKPGEGDGEEEETPGDDKGLAGEVENGGFEVDMFEGPLSEELDDVSQGDTLYVTHPDEANYIAEVESVQTADEGIQWSVDFAGGSYTLRDDTNSQPVGVVEEEPELGPEEKLNPVVDVDDLDKGDTVKYTDPAGYQHYTNVEANITGAAGNTVVTEAGELKENDIEGRVEIDDPLEKYDLPDTAQIEETTNISDAQAAVDFAENVAKAVAEGDATDVSCRPYQYYVGALQDEDLAIDTFQSIVNNDGSATHRDMIERQLRSMDIDPSSVHPEEFGFDPEEVPPKRQDTKFSNFNGEQATRTAAHAIQQNQIGSNNWSQWNDFFDSMTEEELIETAKIGFQSQIDKDGFGSDPMDYETKELTPNESKPDLYDAQRTNMASCFSRIGKDDPDAQREAYEEIKDAAGNKSHQVDRLAATWLTDPDVRREIYSEELAPAVDIDSLTSLGEAENPMLAMQFSQDHEVRARAFLANYVGSTNSTGTKFARSALMNYEGNEGADISKFNTSLAVEGVDPTEEMTESIDRLRDQTAEYIEEEYDGEVTLYRGVSEKVTSNASAESWTTNHSTAKTFDGHAVMEATFEPGDVIASNEIEDHYDWGYNKHGSEKEWTCLGGPLAAAVPDEMTATEYFDENDPLSPADTGQV